MTDTELIRATLERLQLTYSQGSKICGLSEVTFKRYGTVSHKVKPIVWRSLLEYEARLYSRQMDIAKRAVELGAIPPEEKKKRGRPRKSLES